MVNVFKVVKWSECSEFSDHIERNKMEIKDIETVIIKAPEPSDETLKSADDLSNYIGSLNLSEVQKRKLWDKINHFVIFARTDIILSKINDLCEQNNDMDFMKYLH